jgi:hypothetical protein
MNFSGTQIKFKRNYKELYKYVLYELNNIIVCCDKSNIQIKSECT